MRDSISGSLASKPRILLVSHMHARVSKGGGEIAAYQMYTALRDNPNIDAYFLAASGGKIAAPLGSAIFQPFDDREYVAVNHGYDHYIHANSDTSFLKDFEKLLLDLKPDLIHFHHYTNFGVEVFSHIKRLLPDTRIVVTLHEFLAICNHYGQMVKRPSLRLCEEATPRDCAACFPEKTENDFFLRQLFLQHFFGLVDHFISPSHFLADRYVKWGLPAERMAVIENGMPPIEGGLRAPPPIEQGLIIGFFGQISMLKGLNVVIDAGAAIARADPDGIPIRIEIHGDASNQPKEVQANLGGGDEDKETIVRLCGPYQHKDVGRLMQGCHAILVPSIWWENSPLVIQEALAVRRPLICSDIGGMAEKVRDGIDGYHFRFGNGGALAELLMDLAKNPEKLTMLSDTMAVPPTIDETMEQTLTLYQDLIGASELVGGSLAAQ